MARCPCAQFIIYASISFMYASSRIPLGVRSFLPFLCDLQSCLCWCQTFSEMAGASSAAAAWSRKRLFPGEFNTFVPVKICRQTTDKDDEPADIRHFMTRVPKLFSEKKIDPRAHMQFDEFSHFIGSGAGSRVSCGFVLTPTRVGRAVVMVNKCPRRIGKLIRTELGDHIHLITNATGFMDGKT